MISEKNRMGKSEKMNDNMPSLSPQTEASKLLEQALMQMDGIISGSGSLTMHSPDYGFSSSPPGVKEAASRLVAALQNTSAPPVPDPHVVKVILHWIQQVGSYDPSVLALVQRKVTFSIYRTITCQKKMRDYGVKSGALVASVVAVLEKQSGATLSQNKSAGNTRKSAGYSAQNGATENKRITSAIPAEEAIKNRMNPEKCSYSSKRDTTIGNFELAVKAFDCVAEDVERTFHDEISQSESKNTALKLVESAVEKPIGVDISRSSCEFKLKTYGDKGSNSLEDEEGDYITALNEDESSNYETERVVFDNGKLKIIGGAFDYDSDSLEEHTSDDSSGEHYVNGGLETIDEEERISGGSGYGLKGCEDDDDSSLEDEEPTLKNQNRAWSSRGGSESISNHGGSTSDLSSSGSSAEVHNIQQSNSRGNGSTRCTKDFQWISKLPSPSPAPRNSPRSSPIKMEEVPLCKPPIARAVRDKTPKRGGGSDLRSSGAPGSLDRRRHATHKREERDQKSRSSHVKSPPRLDDFQPSHTTPYQNGYGMMSNLPPGCGPYDGCMDAYHRRPDRLEPPRYGSTPMLMEHSRYSERGSHPDLYGECGRYRHEMASCCSSHYLSPPPPCCYYGGGDRSGYSHWAPPLPYMKPGEQDEKIRKLQYEKDNLQLQVQVLNEQIEAQSNKISDLEKLLHEKKQSLSESEEKLQREMLSRSSLETQKLELMTIMSELKLNAAALERENIEMRRGNFTAEVKKPPFLPRTHSGSQPQLTSTPNQSQILRVSPSPSPVVGLTADGTRKSDSGGTQDNLRPKTPPSNYKRQIDIQYGSLPRQQFVTNGGSAINFTTTDANANPHKKGVAFGRKNGIFFNGAGVFIPSLGSRLRGFSVPNLAETDRADNEETNSKGSSPGSPTLSFSKNKGIKKIFGKMKRSGSGNLEDLPPGLGDFTRGGVRATAAARLGWGESRLTTKPEKPFAEWDTENVCDWLENLGLDQYITEAKRWVKTGQQLQECSMTEIEKELNIKNPLHRKKLQLALIDSSENSSSDPYLTKAGQLDTAWVLRWLDDTGLPQHKESFLINRVDGRVLHRLTIDDLALLHVTSLIHVASIKRGIQVLRENNYEPACLTRRSQPDDPEKSSPKQICLWTSHRVMEWLRAVDLAEYAPNLRGAGIHGGLMVLEPKFNPDLLASLLSIPPSKTLLRRHLNTHFKELVGKDIMQEKRDLEGTLGFTPLTPGSKLKVAKKSQFSLKRKKSKGEADYGDLVCPLNAEGNSGDTNSSATNIGMRKIGENQEAEDAYRRSEAMTTSSGTSKSLPSSARNSPLTLRHV